MNPTKLIYLEHQNLYESEATLELTQQDGEKNIIILDQTIFYPQGGGQPYDTGSIKSGETVFEVTEVRWVEGQVHHKGKYLQGVPFKAQQKVSLHVDEARRILHSKLHTAGHIIDNVVQELNLSWLASKGYHYQDSPYVEYIGQITPEQKTSLPAQIEKRANELIQNGFETNAFIIKPEEIQKYCLFPNANFPKDKPLRIVIVFGEKGCPCGGTHVANIQEITHMKIPKIESKGGRIKVKYNL
jgi:Ser-tRNA(Ala) deacylase AlaX